MFKGWKLVATGAAVLSMAAGLIAPASAAPSSTPNRAAMQQLLDTLRNQYQTPGAGFTFGDGTDDVTLSSGTGNVLANAPIRSTDKVRVGSDTKMFVAAVVLLLEDEGVLDLDVPVEQYIPGVVRYPADHAPANPAAYDGRTVTLRQLLQHTAGLPDYADILYVLNPVHELLAPTPKNLLDYGLSKGASYLPGARYRYSNTDYTVIGMVVQAVTGKTIGTQIRDRIVGPLGLHNTFFAERGQKAIPGAYVHGYLTTLLPLDMTNMEPAIWGTAGALVSSPDDMNTFMSALLAGDVLPPARLAEMQDDITTPGGGGYGLGLVRVNLSCGEAWGHAGYLAGYQTFGLAMANGRHAFLTMNGSVLVNLGSLFPGSPYTLIEDALC